MESQVISDAQITASTEWNNYNSAKFARLNLGGWVARAVDSRQWLQVDLGTYSSITSVATQGVNLQGWPKCWTASYNLQYSDDGITFHFYKEPGGTLPKVYPESGIEVNLKMPLTYLKKILFLVIWLLRSELGSLREVNHYVISFCVMPCRNLFISKSLTQSLRQLLVHASF